MATAVETLRAALGLDDKAGVLDIRKTIDQMLLADMTPEEKAKLEALGHKDEVMAPEDEEEAEKKKMVVAQTMSELRSTLSLSETATVPEIITAVKSLAGRSDTTMAMELRELQERVKLLEPKAALAERLEKEARTKSRDLFFSEQIRAGKLIPADREFYTAMWEKDEAAVKKFFESRKLYSAVHLAEVGSDVGGPVDDSDRDPRDVLTELAEKRATEKSIGFVEALNQIKAEQPMLSEQVASLYGPAGLSRSARR